MNLSENCKVMMVKAAQDSGTAAITTDVVDMAGYREVVFLGSITTKNAGNFVNLQEDSASNGATLADLAGTKAASNKTYFKVGLVRPLKRYVAAKITRGVATATGPVWAILFKSRAAPITSAATDLDEETHVSPIAGTA
ncbi:MULTISPECIES: hypothetical protein [Aminobacterium]|uniref:hypothetical protein n=1 Tax=Aminobacterium TaxID=81466 RepID=UPI002580A6B5|nr:hypothetical protein [Aminobacterium sp. UBA4987]